MTQLSDRLARIGSPTLFARNASSSDSHPWRLAPHLAMINDALLDVAWTGGQRLLVNLPPRHGKALEVSTPIPTPNGWSPIGALRPGDEVFDEQGQPCKVVAISPIWRDREAYTVTTDDGDTIVADAEHEWVARLCGKTPSFKRHTTAVIARPRAKRAMIRRQGALVLPPALLPVDPYVLGIWLGDGSKIAGSITAVGDDQVRMRDECHRAGYETLLHADHRNFTVKGIKPHLRRLGILGDKHIPHQYLRANAEQRLALLQGLIDSDGHVAPDGQVEFCSTNRRLADGTRELVHSLGRKASLIHGRATLNGRDCGAKYRIMFYAAGVARLPRKLERCRDAEKTPDRYISAEQTGLADTVCIQVSAPSGMFLCGLSMLPTHNSLLISNYFPAWLVGSFPERRVILASYAAEIAQSWGAGARDLLIEHGSLYGTAVRSDSSKRGRWETRDGGGMLATGVGGQVTGYGADVFIIDDPVKGPVESQSELQQERIWDWYRSVAYTRLQPGASIVIVQTRWHESDLTGRLMAEDPEGWRRIVLPALALDNDPLGREPGDALWPQMFSAETLAETRRVQSDYWWNALYQQSPSPPGGACFHRSWYRHHTITQDAAYQVEPTLDDPMPRAVPIRECRRFVTVDTASSQRTSADYTVLATWDAHPPSGRLFLVDIVRDRLEAPDILPRARRLYDVLHPLYFMVEREFIGLSVVQELKRDGLPVREMSARGLGDKWTRAQDAASKMKAGMISWPSHHTVFEEELAMFPYGAHDDQVDALAYAAIHQSQLGSGRATLVSAADVRIPTRGEAAGSPF